MGDATPDPNDDPRLDPRLVGLCKSIASSSAPAHALDEITSDHATLMAEDAAKRYPNYDAMMTTATPTQLTVAPVESVVRTEGTFTSKPDGNTVRYCLFRPAGVPKEEVLPVIYYIHGGGMTQLSAFYAMYLAWGRLICARSRMSVFMVEFRNALRPGLLDGPHSSGEVKKYPAGLNDCVSGVRYLHTHAADLVIDPDQIFAAGESGGGNLTLATAIRMNKDGDIHLLKGLCVMCPYIIGNYPDPAFPSTISNMGIFFKEMGADGAHHYGIEAYHAKDPCAWPIFAQPADLKGFPPVLVSVNDCDPLRDEGLAMYRKLREAGVSTQARIVVGTCHAAEVFLLLPEVSRATVDAMSAFFRDVVDSTLAE